MPQKFAFTTVAMAAALEETGVTYEDLAAIERQFDDAETEISEPPNSSLTRFTGRVLTASAQSGNRWR
jgi:hypothetical protein